MPAKWEKLTVGFPQAQIPQTGWNQKVNDVDPRLPQHPPVSRRSLSWPYTQQPSLPLFPIKSPSKTWGVGSWFFATWVYLLPRTSDFFNKTIFPFTQHPSPSGLDSWGASGQTWVWWQNALLASGDPATLAWRDSVTAQLSGTQCSRTSTEHTTVFREYHKNWVLPVNYQTSAHIKSSAK